MAPLLKGLRSLRVKASVSNASLPQCEGSSPGCDHTEWLPVINFWLFWSLRPNGSLQCPASANFFPLAPAQVSEEEESDDDSSLLAAAAVKPSLSLRALMLFLARASSSARSCSSSGLRLEVVPVFARRWALKRRASKSKGKGSDSGVSLLYDALQSES